MKEEYTKRIITAILGFMLMFPVSALAAQRDLVKADLASAQFSNDTTGLIPVAAEQSIQAVIAAFKQPEAVQPQVVSSSQNSCAAVHNASFNAVQDTANSFLLSQPSNCVQLSFGTLSHPAPIVVAHLNFTGTKIVIARNSVLSPYRYAAPVSAQEVSLPALSYSFIYAVIFAFALLLSSRRRNILPQLEIYSLRVQQLQELRC